MDRRYQPGQKIAVLATAVLIFSVVSFGAVEAWSSTVAGVSVLTLAMLWLITGRAGHSHTPVSREEKYMLIALLALLAYVFFQVLPLPPHILKHLSPRSFEVYSFYTVDKDPGMHISLYPYRTETGLMWMLVYSLFFILIAFSIKDMDKLDNLLKIMSYFGFGLAVFAILQKAAWNGKIYWIREIASGTPFGPFVNRNHYAGFIGMLVPLTLGLAFTRRRRERGFLFGFFALIMAVSLFLSLSRGGIVSFFAGTALFALILSWQRFRAKKVWAIAAFILGVLLYLSYLGIDPVIDRFYQTDITREERFAVWSETLRAFRDFYLTGSGLGTFINVFPLYSSGRFASLYDHAHNDYLEFILETGIIGTALLSLFLFLSLRTLLGGQWDGRPGIIKTATVSSLFSIMVHSLFDFNLHITSNALMLSFVFGLLLAASRISREKQGVVPENVRKE